MEGDAVCSCSISFTLSIGAVTVREKMPAIAPATAFLNASRGAFLAIGSFDDEGMAVLVAIRNPEYCTEDAGNCIGTFDENFSFDEGGNIFVGCFDTSLPSLSPCRSFHSVLGRFMISQSKLVADDIVS